MIYIFLNTPHIKLKFNSGKYRITKLVSFFQKLLSIDNNVSGTLRRPVYELIYILHNYFNTLNIIQLENA